ncbi:MAG: glucuronate isomerase [Bacteroidota bacterium]|nr:glucuronate isomerase [Bacteroidota bacterium]MDP4193667.1 glucuronate isomerase [Bacteroidota bacterium]
MKDVFIKENFLLNNKTAEKLYYDYAMNQPILDYHCHLPVNEIAENKNFENITRIWLNGDHYKWRAMRSNGVNEKYITGEATDKEKFFKWAETVPNTIKNPLYHWTHMELKKPFGISDRLLNPTTAEGIWSECNDLLQNKEFSTKGLIKHFNVEALCTTDDPADSLEYHKAIKESNFEVKVLPTFRPDKAMAVENVFEYNSYLEKLQIAASISIGKFVDLLDALKRRHEYFHEMGCRISDHGLETAYAEDYTEKEINSIFEKLLLKKNLSLPEILKFKSAMMFEFGIMDFQKGWVQQIHLGALRNTNTRMFRLLGADTGLDTIGDFEMAGPLAKYLNSLDNKSMLPKTIIYNLNPANNELFAAMIGNFQDGNIPGKIQYGSGWWFLDQKSGIEKQIDALSNMGLLSRFIGMLTDSRSFLSYPRHEYFRRILCNILGGEIENGTVPDDIELVGNIVKDICYRNAKRYFCFEN